MNLPQFDPYKTALKKNMREMLENRYTLDVDETIDRITSNMVTRKDIDNLFKFLGFVYQSGFDKAVNSVQDAIEKNGLKIKLRFPK